MLLAPGTPQVQLGRAHRRYRRYPLAGSTSGFVLIDGPAPVLSVLAGVGSIVRRIVCGVRVAFSVAPPQISPSLPYRGAIRAEFSRGPERLCDPTITQSGRIC